MKISDLELTIKKPSKVINEQDIEISLKYKDEMQRKSDEIRKLQEQNEVSNKTIIQLQGILKDLKQRLYPEGTTITYLLALTYSITLGVNSKLSPNKSYLNSYCNSVLSVPGRGKIRPSNQGFITTTENCQLL